jgi:hypothetical protein
MSVFVRIVGLLIIGLFLYGNASAAPCPFVPVAPSDTCKKKDVVVERDVIDTAVNVGLITLEEANQLRKDIAEGKKDIIDVDSPDGIITFGTITYDEELGENVLEEVDPEEGEYIDGEWYDAYH